MPIIDLKTGEMTDEQPFQLAPSARDEQSIKGKSESGIIDLNTGGYIDQAPKVDINKDRDTLLKGIVDNTSGLDSMMISAGKTVADLGRFLGQGEEETPVEKQALSMLREERPITSALGQALPFVVPGVGVANIASLPTRVLAATGLGGLEGATISSGTGQDVFKGTGIGALIGGGLELAFPVVGRIGSQLFRKLTGKPPVAPIVDSVGNPSAEFQNAISRAGLSFDDVLKATGDVAEDTTQLARKSFLEENGLIPTRAQVTGGATDFQTQQELAKTTGRVRAILEGQEQVLANRFENAITQTGGTANPSNSPVFDFIGDKAVDLDSAIGDAYKVAKEIAGDVKSVKTTNLIEQVRSIAGSDSATGGLAGATRDILRAKGLITGKALKSDARINPTQAEGVRQDLNALFDSLTPFGRKKLSEFKDALDSDVARDVGEDIFQEARSMKAKFEGDLNRVKVNKFDKRKANVLRDILENKINPERFLDDAVLAKRVRGSDLEQVKRYMLLDDNPAGIAAWNDLRAEAMQRIAKDSLPEVSGEQALSRAQLERVLDRFGRDKLRVLFNRDERDFLNSMLKISKLREPVRMTQQGRGPSAQAVEKLAQAMERLPLVADSFRGVATRISNNKALELPEPIRNNLLRSLQPSVTGAAVVTTQQQDNK
tara:strand:+ start:1095 stop:3074 length:1980 start_codon:yes stop_codon:yes gene_type:complete